ncbi:hypothetical protein E2562_013406 [Oryza meyeriana var. granulata]|uniref:Uncharacterized protein n=1 Tax=Oryza meyeriana var. granulata TaxID=110450 RepID=A0A6G1EA54_9ORYZ|nr:hypothetical protein E2562_013406 [Oryza meyeriana var. granulata]KAF0921669.1 hypothetical protein E2562_013406 [Oryza meyeriana var. granulata]
MQVAGGGFRTSDGGRGRQQNMSAPTTKMADAGPPWFQVNSVRLICLFIRRYSRSSPSTAFVTHKPHIQHHTVLTSCINKYV